MKKICIVFLIALAGCSTKESNGEEDYLLTPSEFQDKIVGDAVIIDVRTSDEFSSGNLPMSINIDYKNPAFQQNILLLDKEKTYLVYCASGVRSTKAAELMRSEGFKKVYALDGGLDAWEAASLESGN